MGPALRKENGRGRLLDSLTASSGSAARWFCTVTLFVVLIAIAFPLASPAKGADADTQADKATAANPDDAVKSGAEALRSDNRFPWYDAEHDTLRPVVLHQFRDNGKLDPNDDSSKSPHTAHTGDGSSGSDGSGQESSPPPSFDMPEISAPWLIWVVWIVIGGVLVFLAVMLIRAFLNREARKATPSDGEAIETQEAGDRLDALPVRVKPKGGLLDEARRCYEAGDYNQAIIFLYGYQLLRLDQNQWIRLAKGKTNRQYLRELSGRGELQAVLSRTIVPFEDVYFGDHALDRPRFEACWTEIERFDRLVERTTP